MDERAFYSESQTTKPATLNCPYCHSVETYDLRWAVRQKKDRMPGGGDERDRAKFAKAPNRARGSQPYRGPLVLHVPLFRQNMNHRLFVDGSTVRSANAGFLTL